MKELGLKTQPANSSKRCLLRRLLCQVDFQFLTHGVGEWDRLQLLADFAADGQDFTLGYLPCFDGHLERVANRLSAHLDDSDRDVDFVGEAKRACVLT